MAKQVIFKDRFANDIHAGILLENGDIICGCCGCHVDSEDREILHIYDSWVSLEAEITGDDSFVIFTNDNPTVEEIKNYFKENN